MPRPYTMKLRTQNSIGLVALLGGLLVVCAGPLVMGVTRPATPIAAGPVTRAAPAARPGLNPEWVLSIPWCAGNDDEQTPLCLSYGLGEGKFDVIDRFMEEWHAAGGRRVFIPCPYGRQAEPGLDRRGVYRFDQRQRLDQHPKLAGTPLQTSFPQWLRGWQDRGVSFVIQTGTFGTAPGLTQQQVNYELEPYAGCGLAIDSCIASDALSVDYGLALSWRGRFYVERPPFKSDGVRVEHWRRFDRLCVENQFTNAAHLAEHDPEFTGEYLVLQETNLEDPLQFLADLWRAKRQAGLKGPVTPAFRMEAVGRLVEALGAKGK